MWLLNAMIIAIAMYSKIPMPRVDWNEKNMRYAMCFFPLVGVIIGVLEIVVGNLARTCARRSCPGRISAPGSCK